jgi:hydroxymethylbilane synthase
MILAGAGMERLGLTPSTSTPIPIEKMLPAVGQGALALEARAGDQELLDQLRHLDHGATAIAVKAERAFLRRLEGGCTVPVAALSTIHEDRLVLEGYLGTADGRRYLRRRAEATIPEAEQLGTRLAEQILAEGGTEILEETLGGNETKDG